MNSKEAIMLDKMLFINKNKEVLKDNILSRIDNSNIAFLLLGMLLSNKEKKEELEYNKILKFINDKDNSIVRESTNIYDIIGVIKTYVCKIYNGKEELDKIMSRLTECENVFNRYQEKNQKIKIMVI